MVLTFPPPGISTDALVMFNPPRTNGTAVEFSSGKSYVTFPLSSMKLTPVGKKYRKSNRNPNPVPERLPRGRAQHQGPDLCRHQPMPVPALE